MSGKTGIQWTNATWNPVDEEWRSVPSYPAYEVTTSGKIRNARTGHLLHPMQRKGSGHLYIIVPRSHKLYIHRAVLEAFIGPRPNGMECRHLDGNSQNNDLSNLAWGTRLENADDTRRHGRKRVAAYRLSPLNAEQVAEIKLLLPTMTRRALAKHFGVSHTTINKIAQGKRWQEVTCG